MNGAAAGDPASGRPTHTSVGALPTATPEEAAAIVVAVERFLHETTPLPAVPADGLDGWTRAAMLEGVERSRPHCTHPWIDA